MIKQMKGWDNIQTDDLIKALLTLRNGNEGRRFLRDLLTERELLEIGKRWRVARMLNEGVSYSKIEKTTGMSSTTVARIAGWLKEGMSGYRLILDRMYGHHRGKRSSGKSLR
jgi:TrpR-related protein YerC/YecD